MVGTSRTDGTSTEGRLRPIHPHPVSNHEPSRSAFPEIAWILWRYKWSVLLITLVAVGLGILISARQTPIYDSRARVLVLPLEEVPASPFTSRPNLATESELVTSISVSRAVADDLGIDEGTRVLLDDVSVEPIPDTEILEIHYRDADPSQARDRAQAFAEEYIRYRQTTAAAELTASAEDLAHQIRKLERQFQRLQAELDSLASDDPDAVILRNEAAVIQGQILERQLERLDVETASVRAGEIVEPATEPTSPASPNHLINGALGLAAGLALGVGSAYARDRFSDRVRSAAEVEDYLAAPVLGWIPRVAGWRRKKRAMVISLERWRSPAAEAYRSLRTNVLSALTADGGKSVAVTSPNPGDGKTATVANLAVVLARSGKRVTIISGDLRRPRLHAFFDVDGSVGLTDVLTGRTPVRGAMRKINFATSPWTGPPALPLWIMPSGQTTHDDEELLTSDALERLIMELEQVSDIVLIDLPPVLSVTDALVVAPKVDAVLLVVGPDSATGATVTAARQRLDRVGARVLGVVINRASVRAPGYRTSYGY